MNSYNFVLNFTLPHREDDPEQYLDVLFEAGCDDATLGVGKRGIIGLDFTRRAPDAETALHSAIKDVEKAIPGAVLFQVGPDLVSISDMAEIFGFSRQNMWKYAFNSSSGRDAFPAPVVLSETNLWHLAETILWLKSNTNVPLDPRVIDVSKAAVRANFAVEKERLRKLEMA